MEAGGNRTVRPAGTLLVNPFVLEIVLEIALERPAMLLEEHPTVFPYTLKAVPDLTRHAVVDAIAALVAVPVEVNVPEAKHAIALPDQ